MAASLSGTIPFGQPLLLPPALRVLRPRLHPCADEVRRLVDAWTIERMTPVAPTPGAMARILQQQLCTWAPYCLPDAPIDRIVEISKFVVWVSEADTMTFDEVPLAQMTPRQARRQAKRLERILRGEPVKATNDGWTSILTEFWEHFGAELSETIRDRFVIDAVDYMDASLEVRAHNAANQLPPYDDYLTLRARNYGFAMFGRLTEHAMGIDLSAEFARDPRLKELDAKVSGWQGLFNDIISYRREHLAGLRVNAVDILRHERGCSLQDAITAVTETLWRIEADFITARDALQESELGHHSAVTTYLKAVANYIPGDWYWTLSSSRYSGTSHSWNGVPPTAMSFTPTSTIFTTQ